VERSFLTAQDRLVKELRVDYQIERADIVLGLCGARLRIEERLDGTMAVAFQGKYLRYRKCEPAPPVGDLEPAAKPAKTEATERRRTPWRDNFDLRKSLPVWRAARVSETRRSALHS